MPAAPEQALAQGARTSGPHITCCRTAAIEATDDIEIPARRRTAAAPQEMSAQHTDVVVVEPGMADREYWRELWRKRELLWFLAWRDTLVRYKQTAVGLAWVLIRPICTLLIFTLVFGKIAQLPSVNVPYPLLVLSGLLPWLFFASAVSDISNGVISNAALVGKVYFPRMIIPLSGLFVGLVDYLVSCCLLVVVALAFGTGFSWRLILLPLLTLWVAALALGVGMIGAALNVRYRDFRQLIPFLLQLGVYISPVGYSASLVTGRWRLVYSLNPLAGIIDGFRWATLGLESTNVYLPGLVASLLLTVVLLVLGVVLFRRAERRFVDFL
jgi:lipopolysaccharide transport system permease protein